MIKYQNQISEANPDPNFRLAGRIYNSAFYRLDRPDLRIRIGRLVEFVWK